MTSTFISGQVWLGENDVSGKEQHKVVLNREHIIIIMSSIISSINSKIVEVEVFLNIFLINPESELVYEFYFEV